MIFRDMDLDFDIFDADDAEAYEAAAKEVGKKSATKPGESLADTIRRQCWAVFGFFDELFGEGFHKELFGERTNLKECLIVFREFIEAVNAQKSEFEAVTADISAGSAAPNRAARRAAARGLSKAEE